MSDFLSQDQIDDLLRQQEAENNDSDSGTSEAGADALSVSDHNYSALTEAFELFCLQAGTVISTLLNREISFTVTQSEVLNTESLQNAISGPQLVLTIPLSGALSGEFSFILETKEVAILSDLMMMGDGKAEFNDDHKDAIAELFNQIMGSYTTALGEHFGDSVSSGAIEVKEFDFANPSIPLENSDMVMITTNIPEIGEHVFGVIVSNECSQQLMEKFDPNQGFGTAGDSGLSTTELNDITQTAGVDDDSDSSYEDSPMTGSNIQAPNENITMLMDVELDVCIELGRADLAIKRILELAPGSIVELDRMAGEPVDLMVNNKVVAKGEVVVVDENFGIRIVSLVSPEERIKSLR